MPQHLAHTTPKQTELAATNEAFPLQAQAACLHTSALRRWREPPAGLPVVAAATGCGFWAARTEQGAHRAHQFRNGDGRVRIPIQRLPACICSLAQHKPRAAHGFANLHPAVAITVSATQRAAPLSQPTLQGCAGVAQVADAVTVVIGRAA